VSEILGSILGSALKGLAGQTGQQESAPGGLPDILAQVLGKTDLGSLGGLLQQLEQSGLGAQVASWLGNGQNQPVTTDQLRNALGEQPLKQLASQLNLPVDELLRHLAQHLPGAVDTLSPNGSLAKDLGSG
jgi:uncharacterized protein YidB (DUF937 family)